MRSLLLPALLAIAATSTLVAPFAQAANTIAQRIKVTSEFDKGQAFFDIWVNDQKDLHGIVYTTPTEPAPIALTFNQILNPKGPRAGYGGVIVTWKSERPAVVLVANANTLDQRHGGEFILKYLHNGKDKESPKFKQLAMRIVREGDTWKVLTDDHSTEIRSICFRKKTYWGFTVGAERHEINRSCPQT